jgi:hypothetical protein
MAFPGRILHPLVADRLVREVRWSGPGVLFKQRLDADRPRFVRERRNLGTNLPDTE